MKMYLQWFDTIGLMSRRVSSLYHTNALQSSVGNSIGQAILNEPGNGY